MQKAQKLAETEGIFTETAGGVTIAVTKKLIEQRKIPKDESIVISITGNGMKTIEALQKTTPSLPTMSPKLEEFEKILQHNLYEM